MAERKCWRFPQPTARNDALDREIHRSYPSISAFCSAHHLAPGDITAISEFLNLRRSPIRQNGEYRLICLRLSIHLQVPVARLFPLRLYRYLLPRRRRAMDINSLPEIPSPSAPPEQELWETERRERIEKVLNTLTYREREILKLRYGLGDGYSYSREEIAGIFRISRMNTLRIEERSLAKLRHPLRAKLLESFVTGHRLTAGAEGLVPCSCGVREVPAAVAPTLRPWEREWLACFLGFQDRPRRPCDEGELVTEYRAAIAYVIAATPSRGTPHAPDATVPGRRDDRSKKFLLLAHEVDALRLRYGLACGKLHAFNRVDIALGLHSRRTHKLVEAGLGKILWAVMNPKPGVLDGKTPLWPNGWVPPAQALTSGEIRQRRERMNLDLRELKALEIFRRLLKQKISVTMRPPWIDDYTQELLAALHHDLKKKPWDVRLQLRIIQQEAKLLQRRFGQRFGCTSQQLNTAAAQLALSVKPVLRVILSALRKIKALSRAH